MRSTLVGILLTGILGALVFLVSASAPAGPAPAPGVEPLAAQVTAAIDKGKAWLRRQQKNGSWDVRSIEGEYPGGATGLAMLALLTSGASLDDKDDRPVLQAGLAYLQGIKPSQTYVVSLQTMVYVLMAHNQDDLDRIQANVDWLQKVRHDTGWSYNADPTNRTDNSNTQFALLALHEAMRAGAKVDKEALKSVQEYFVKNQDADGTWSYIPNKAPASMTMTTAGVSSLLITGMDLEDGAQQLQADGSAKNCGEYTLNKPVAKGLDWIGASFPGRAHTLADAAGKFSANVFNPAVDKVPFYGLYGIERVGRLSGERFIGGHDWYRVGCECLVGAQNADGFWAGTGADGDPGIATSFALLFLAKGRTPVLMTKLAYGQKGDTDWHHKHNDMRNVVEYASREMFKKQPMAWQNFDIRDQAAENDAAIHDLAEQLLESPIVYFSGHEDVPDGNQVALLKEYVENGGFLFIEACCNAKDHPGYDTKVRKLMKDLFDDELKPLDPNHPLYSASGHRSDPGVFPLEGIERGCKTVAVYSPNAISGYWEANDTTSDKGKAAFTLADNVIAYATGLEPPRQKLDSVQIIDSNDKTVVKRGFLRTAQLMHDGEWQPAPKAMHNLMVEARAVGLDVALDPDPIHPSRPDVVNYPFLYMHGRSAFSYKPEELEHLRFALEKKGALLFADACCGSDAFDESFRKFMDELWKDSKDKPKLEPIPPDDELFSEELNGKGRAIDYVMCRREKPDGSGVDHEFKKVKPALEGIKINGRWVVIYSRYDIGCALEHHPTPGCLGHDYPSAVALGRAAVLYLVNR